MIFFILVCYWSCGTAQDSNSAYVLVHGNNSQSFSLMSTRTTVSIYGVIADVKLVQLYENLSEQNIDVDYIFPITPEATVYAMQIIHQGYLIVGQLKTAEVALQDYQTTEATGNISVLLQETQDNVLQMSIANILPNGILRTEVYYTLNMVPELGVYEFYFPSIVGPQYTESSGIESPDLSHDFSISINLHLPFPVQSIGSTTHPSMNITFQGNSANASFSSVGATQDILLQYSMSNDQILAGVITYQPSLDNNNNLPFYVDDKGALVLMPMGTTNYFLAIIQTPSPTYITPFIVPREYIFVLDTSASMAGLPAKVLRELTTEIIWQLRPDSDYFNVVAFSGGTSVYSEESVLVSNESLSKGINFVYSMKSQGFSGLLEALEKAVSIPRVVGSSRIICVLTDGLVYVENEIFSFIQYNSGNANFYAFAIGSIPNRVLTQGIAFMGRGKEFWAQTTQDATTIGSEFITHILSPVLTNVSLQFSSSFAVDLDTVWPSQFGDVMGDRPLMVIGQFNGSLSANDTLFTVSGLTANGTWTSDVVVPILEEENQMNSHSLIYLWANTMIQEITYTEPSNSTMITDIALNYNILSVDTSFVAIVTGVQISDDVITNINIPVCPIYCPSSCDCGSYSLFNCPAIQCGTCGPILDKCHYNNDLNCSECVNKGPGLESYPNPSVESSLKCFCPPTLDECDMYQCNSGIWVQCGICNGTAPCSNCSDLSPQPDSQQVPLANLIFKVPSGINTTQDCFGIFSGSNGGFLCDNQNYIFLETSYLTLMDDTQIFLDGSLACEGNFSVSAPLTLTMTSTITVSSTIYINNNLTIDMTNQSIPTDPIKLIDVPTTSGNFSNVNVVGIDSTCYSVIINYEENIGVLFSLKQKNCEPSSGSNWSLIVGVCVSSFSLVASIVVGILIMRFSRVSQKKEIKRIKRLVEENLSTLKSSE